MKKIIGLFLILAMASPVFAWGCSGEIIGLTVDKTQYYPGEIVTGTVQVKLETGFPAFHCHYILDIGVVPPTAEFSTLRPLGIIVRDPAQCCAGNDNYVSIPLDVPMIDIGEPITCTGNTCAVPFSVNLPNENSYDHCGGGPPRTTPGFYWNGYGTYNVKFTLTNGCYNEIGDDMVVYDSDVRSIQILDPSGNGGNGGNIKNSLWLWIIVLFVIIGLGGWWINKV